MTKLADFPRDSKIFRDSPFPEARRVRLYQLAIIEHMTDRYNMIERTFREHLWYSLDFVRELDYIRAILKQSKSIRQHIYGVQCSLRDLTDLRKVSAKVRNGGLRSRHYTQSILDEVRKGILNSFIMRICGFLKENKYRNFL